MSLDTLWLEAQVRLFLSAKTSAQQADQLIYLAQLSKSANIHLVDLLKKVIGDQLSEENTISFKNPFDFQCQQCCKVFHSQKALNGHKRVCKKF